MCTFLIQYGNFYLLGLKLDSSDNSLLNGKSRLGQNYDLLVKDDHFGIDNSKQPK